MLYGALTLRLILTWRGTEVVEPLLLICTNHEWFLPHENQKRKKKLRDFKSFIGEQILGKEREVLTRVW